MASSRSCALAPQGVAPDVRLRDIVLGMGVCTDSNYAHQFNAPGTLAPIADFGLLRRAADAAERLGYPVRVGNVLSSDVFYDEHPTASERWAKMGVLPWRWNRRRSTNAMRAREAHSRFSP